MNAKTIAEDKENFALNAAIQLLVNQETRKLREENFQQMILIEQMMSALCRAPKYHKDVCDNRDRKFIRETFDKVKKSNVWREHVKGLVGDA